MDPDKQGALNSIENSVYRTAFKLRSVQTLCQLDLMDSSLIQQVLLHQSFAVSRESSISVQQLFQTLQELFGRARAGKPGQVHPRAAELALSLLVAMYDSTASSALKLLPVATALIALSGDSPLTKYRALFQLYVENNRGGSESCARMTRRVLRNLLTDLQQIPTVVGESRSLCSVESAIRSCFRGVLSPGIKEEKFLSWAQSEPLILLWLPTCHRLSATEALSHPVRCCVCGAFPVTGLRYRCQKCLNFDICQVCFLSDLHSKSHQKSHTTTEPCVQVTSNEHTKLLLRTLRINLRKRRLGKQAIGRDWPLDQPTPQGMHHHAQFMLLQKQLKQCKAKLRAMYTSQEEKSCRFETEIQELTTNQDSLRHTLQQMGQDLQAMLKPPCPSPSSQNLVSMVEQSSADRLWRGDSSHIKSVTGDGLGWEPPTDSAEADGNHRSNGSLQQALPNSEPQKTILQSSRAQSHAQKMLKETHSSLHHCQDGLLLDKPQISPAELSSPSWEPVEGKETSHVDDRKDELEGEELQELLSKLLEAFSLEGPSDPQPSVDMDVHGRAEQVCETFSALVEQITLPHLK
uniref:dystrotelin n=1 Tax=Jaculus jaculus TaxID=51337 RepID=UPI001E1B2CED|nr:dystrotelin [Jaculus jaculus]